MKDIDFPATNKDWKKIELNNKVALNILIYKRSNFRYFFRMIINIIKS